MKRLIIVGTAILVTALFVGGMFSPNSMLMWFASTSVELTWIRGAILIALILLFVTDPPRGTTFRFSLMGFAAFLGIISVSSSLETFYVGIIDSVVFAQVAILLAIEGLEVGPAHAKDSKDDVDVLFRKALAALRNKKQLISGFGYIFRSGD